MENKRSTGILRPLKFNSESSQYILPFYSSNLIVIGFKHFVEKQTVLGLLSFGSGIALLSWELRENKSKLSRRDFLKRGVGAGLGTIVSSVFVDVSK